MANEVQFAFSQVASTLPYAKTGRMRMLAVIAPERSKVLPDVPTIRESGYDMVVGAWIARDAVRLGIPWPLRTLALLLTFLAGPVGFLLHLLARAGLRRRFSVDRTEPAPADC